MTKEWNKHDTGVLMQRTLALLANTTKRDLDIYNDTGIQPGWLVRFRTGRIADPGVNRVECLYNYLSGRALEL